MSPKKSASELAETNLKFYGRLRLEAMDEAFLQDVLKEYEVVEPMGSKDDIVAKLLELKSERAAKLVQRHVRERTKAAVLTDAKGLPLPDGERTKLIPLEDSPGVALEVTVAKKDEPHTFKTDRQTLRVASFNSLKLRTGRAGLAEHWYQLAATLSTVDCLMVQEVPNEGSCKDFESTRAFELKRLLEHQTNSKWTAVRSEPSGPGNLEVHVCFVREPVEVVSHATHTSAGGIQLDHAPFSVRLKVPFEKDSDVSWVVTSVHLPPKSRAKQRDVQLHALLREYSMSSEIRLNTPLTQKGASDARVAQTSHVICGDFNRWVDPDEFELKRNGFAPPTLPEGVATSSGGQAYDNFLVSKNAANRFLVSADVLELTMAKVPGQEGLSDHNPIILCIKSTATTKNKPKPTRSSSPAPRRRSRPVKLEDGVLV